MYKVIKKNEDGEFEFWYNPNHEPKNENLFPDIVMEEWEKHTISIPFYSDDDKNKILNECFENYKKDVDSYGHSYAIEDLLDSVGIPVYDIELHEVHTVTKSGSFIDYRVKYKNPNDPKILEDYLKYFETVKYESYGFGMIFLYYRYEDKKWDIAFRNSKNFDNPEIIADTPLEACKKMFEFLKSHNKL